MQCWRGQAVRRWICAAMPRSNCLWKVSVSVALDAMYWNENGIGCCSVMIARTQYRRSRYVFCWHLCSICGNGARARCDSTIDEQRLSKCIPTNHLIHCKKFWSEPTLPIYRYVTNQTSYEWKYSYIPPASATIILLTSTRAVVCVEVDDC